MGALIGVFTGLVLQFWKSLRDERRVLCDEFCKVALEAADLASAYWKGGEDASDLSAARLIAIQRRLNGYHVMLELSFTREGNQEIERTLADLFDSLTGGEFQSKAKAPDEVRLRSAQTNASELVVVVRRSFIEAVRAKHLAKWLFVGLPAEFFFQIGRGVLGAYSWIRDATWARQR